MYYYYNTTNTNTAHRRAYGCGAPNWPYCGSCTKKACKIGLYFVQFFFLKPIDKSVSAWYTIINKEREVHNMMTKEQMMDNVIRQRGFEDRWTIWFCELAEVLTESQLLNAYILIESGCVDSVEEEE